MREYGSLRVGEKTLDARGVDLRIKPRGENISLISGDKSFNLPASLKRHYERFPEGFDLSWYLGNEEIYRVEFYRFEEGVSCWHGLVEVYDYHLSQPVANLGDAQIHAEFKTERESFLTCLPVVNLCSYDVMAVETREDRDSYGWIYLYAHDAHDYGGGKSRLKIANSMDQLLEEWSKRAFSMPLDWNWQLVWNETTERWNDSAFDQAFCIKDL